MLYQAFGLSQKLEQSLLLGGRGSVLDRCGLANECSQRRDADQDYILHAGRASTGYTPYTYSKTARDATLLSQNKPRILPGGRGVPAAPSIAADVSVSAIFTTKTDVSAALTTTTSIAGGPSPLVAEDPTTHTQVPPVTPDLAAVSAHADTEVHADESCSDDNKTASEQVSAEHTIDVSTTVAASESDGDPLPYAPYASWEMVPTPLGSIHAYYDMEEHTKHFTSLRELLHMVEKNDLRKLLGAVDNFYQRQQPDTFSLILWGDLCVLFQTLADEDAYAFWRNQESWRIHSWHLYPRPHVHVLETVDGRVIYMFVDVSYPLREATLKCMLKHGLEVPKLLVGGDLTMAEQLVSFIKAALLNAQSAV
nr:hypothetical protein [Tanacetum cinerariifolium]